MKKIPPREFKYLCTSLENRARSRLLGFEFLIPCLDVKKYPQGNSNPCRLRERTACKALYKLGLSSIHTVPMMAPINKIVANDSFPAERLDLYHHITRYCLKEFALALLDVSDVTIS